MSYSDWNSDTEPTGCPPASDEGPDADADEATEPNDAPREDVAAGVSEHDTDDFLRWLPTLALGHRRRAELVERSSSHGADFAAYACEGRPAATSGQPRIRIRGESAGGAGGSKDLGAGCPHGSDAREARAARVAEDWVGCFLAWSPRAPHSPAGPSGGWTRAETALQRGEAVATAPMPTLPHSDAAGRGCGIDGCPARDPIAGFLHGRGEDGCEVEEPLPRAQPWRMRLAREIRPRARSPSPRRHGAKPHRWPPRRPSQAKDQYFEAP